MNVELLCIVNDQNCAYKATDSVMGNSI